MEGVFFGVWAPNAASVHVIGEFNGWNEESHPMEKLGPGGIHKLFVPGVQEGCMYKFLITTQDGYKLYKADPFANYAEYRPGTASRVTDLSGFAWEDGKWLEERDQKDVQKQPLAIYECHIGSFMKHPDGTKEGFYNYWSTSYLIWGNDAAKAALGVELVGEGPDISPCYLMNLVFQQLGWEGPAFMQAMTGMMNMFPVVSSASGLTMVDGRLTADIPEDRRALFQEFLYLQQYWRNEFLYE